mmetsp:Transcript_30668/g.91011  ORF Transcript_30668/g.91011 Transcript_30668/m.91011 type:complete len:217 (-) Transcript_30668:82-732(-)
MPRSSPMERRTALRAAIGALASAAVLLSLQPVFASPSWVAARGEAPAAGLAPKPFTAGPTQADAEVLAVPEKPARRGLRFGLAAAGAALMAVLPRRKGQGRMQFQGLASAAGGGFLATLPDTFQALLNSQAGLMLRLSSLNFCKIYMAMLVLRITIMWFPNINPYRQPFYSMIQLTDPYLNLFRGWMPPIFGIDLSVILAFVVIQAVIDTLTLSPF